MKKKYTFTPDLFIFMKPRKNTGITRDP